ncbi:hypothetical protein FF098_017110 [Parvularcula flava]|uniref:Uncharacterized protein n=2 Tax=Aquisalinus luteolus TaxID=1566827 RepID=A0A8J3A6F5_9PROT|nr:hypothetical protein [Aquisalinus luteolus]NHK29630.1 hypothetical protein [Aquisalinus luteolus]GGI02282.1 hypothetical protein GCM10011355_34920 [Aquisalinus luteolus]
MREHIEAEITRTGLGLKAVVRGVKNRPENLTVGNVERSLFGDYKTIRADVYAFYVALYASLPDGAGTDTRHLRRRGIIRMDSPEGRELCTDFERLNIAPETLCDLYPEIESKPITLYKYFTGSRKTMPEAEYERLRHALSDLASKGEKELAKLRSIASGKVRISKDYLQDLQTQIARTGQQPEALFAQYPELPHEVKPARIRQWLSDIIRHEAPERLEYVLATYRALPDSTP